MATDNDMDSAIPLLLVTANVGSVFEDVSKWGARARIRFFTPHIT